MSNVVQTFIDHLCSHTALTDEEQAALLTLPAIRQKVVREQKIVDRDDVTRSICVVEKGLLARTYHTNEGARQITSFYVPGDMPDLSSLMRPRVTLGIVSMCASEVLRIPHAPLRNLLNKYPGIAEAVARELVRESDIANEWVVNVGSRLAKERIAHLFCEMAIKSGKAQDENARFTFPVSQTILGEATGLSTVHVNRSIQALRQGELLRFEHGEAAIPNWQALADTAGFNGDYLEAAPLRYAN